MVTTHLTNHKRFLRSKNCFLDLDTKINEDSSSKTILTTGNIRQVQDELNEEATFMVEVTIEDMEDMIDNLKSHIRKIKKANETT